LGLLCWSSEEKDKNPGKKIYHGHVLTTNPGCGVRKDWTVFLLLEFYDTVSFTSSLEIFSDVMNHSYLFLCKLPLGSFIHFFVRLHCSY
jgi:hypothetical protein